MRPSGNFYQNSMACARLLSTDLGGFMPYQFYLFLHLVSLLTVAISLGAIVGHILQGGTKATLKTRKPLMIIHGVGLLFAFVTGFAMMGKGGFNLATSQWLFVKMFCWILLGAFPVLVYKKVLPKWANLAGLILILAAAAYAVTFKPF